MSRYLSISVNRDKIDLDPINNTCVITESAVEKDVTLKNDDTDPKFWSRDVLLNQFKLLSTYPWYNNTNIKELINNADHNYPTVYVKLEGYEYPVNINKLQNYNDIPSISKMFKLKLRNGITGLYTYTSEGSDLNVLNAALDVDTGAFPDLPDFKLDSEGNMICNANLDLYSCTISPNGIEENINTDIYGFYYQVPEQSLKYSLDENSSFIIEFKLPRNLGINLTSMNKFISGTDTKSATDIKQDYFPSYNHSTGTILNVHWPPKVGDRVYALDKHENLWIGSGDSNDPTTWTRYVSEVIKINEVNEWVGPWDTQEGARSENNAIDQIAREGLPVLMTQTDVDAGTVSGEPGWYQKFNVKTWDVQFVDDSDTPDVLLNDYSRGNTLKELGTYKNSIFDTEAVRRLKGRYNGETYNDELNNIAKDFYYLWTIYPFTQKEFIGETKPDGSNIVTRTEDTTYFNDAVLTPVIAESKAYISFADLQRVAYNSTSGNAEVSSYGRLVLKPKSIDEPMYLDSELTIPCLTIEQRGEVNNMWGLIQESRYVYSSSRFLDSEGLSLDYGERNVIKQLGMYWVFDFNSAQPYSMRMGILIDDKSSGGIIRGNIDDGSGNLVELNSDVRDLLKVKGDNYYTHLKQPDADLDDNLLESFDIITRGSIIKRNDVKDMYNIPSFDEIRTNNHQLGYIINKYIKLGEIFIVETGQDIHLSEKLVNNGIIYIHSGGKMTVLKNGKAKIINNGIIYNYGHLVEDGSISELSGYVSHHTDILPGIGFDSNGQANGIIFQDSDVRTLKDYVHSVLVSARTQKLVAGVTVRYENPDNKLYSKESALMIGTNVSTSSIPDWNQATKRLNFEIQSPILTSSGRTVPKFYTIFIPDFLVSKWWNRNRDDIQNSIGTDLMLKRVNYNTGELESASMVTNKITNEAMKGLYLAIEL
jgi:hypothetical protein